MGFLLVFVGGGLGSVLRHAVNLACTRFLAPAFPWGTFTVNVTGSFIMGLFAGYLALRGSDTTSARLFLMTGVLGGYTTFSAYSLDAFRLYERGDVMLAGGYVVGSVLLSLAAVVAGFAVARNFA